MSRVERLFSKSCANILYVFICKEVKANCVFYYERTLHNLNIFIFLIFILRSNWTYKNNTTWMTLKGMCGNKPQMKFFHTSFNFYLIEILKFSRLLYTFLCVKEKRNEMKWKHNFWILFAPILLFILSLRIEWSSSKKHHLDLSQSHESFFITSSIFLLHFFRHSSSWLACLLFLLLIILGNHLLKSFYNPEQKHHQIEIKSRMSGDCAVQIGVSFYMIKYNIVFCI